MSLPANWAPQRAEHVRREFVVDLAAIGVPETSLEQALEADFWAGFGHHFQVGDEVRLIGRGFDESFRVASIGPDGVSLETFANAVAQTPRHLWIARIGGAPDVHMAQWQIGALNHNAEWQDFAKGQRNLKSLGELIGDEIERRGPFDLTLSLYPIASIRNDLDHPPLEPGAAILAGRGTQTIAVMCPIQPGDTIWTRLYFAKGEVWAAPADERFVVKVLPDRVREAFSHPGLRARACVTEVWVRPNWSAKAIAPEFFPERPVNAHADAQAAEWAKQKRAQKIPRDKRPRNWAADPLWWKGIDI